MIAPPGAPHGRSGPPARRWLIAAVLSLVGHALLLLVIGLWWVQRDPPPEEMEVVTIFEGVDTTAPVEEPLPLAAPHRLPVGDAELVPAEEPDAEELAEDPPPDEVPPTEDPEPVEQAMLEREQMQSVHQPDRGSEAPEQADYLAEVDNRAAEETVAEEVALVREGDAQERAEALGVEAAPEQGAPEESDAPELPAEEADPEPTDADAPEADAPEPDEAVEQELADPEHEEPSTEQPDDAPESGAVDPVDVSEGSAAEPEDASGPQAGDREVAALTPEEMVERLVPRDGVGRLPAPRPDSVARATASFSADAYQEVFGARDARERNRVTQEERARGFLGDHEAEWDALREALANHDIRARAGRETSLNTRADAFAGYIHYLHDKIHARWPPYLRSLDVGVGAGHPLSDMNLWLTLEYVIADDGTVSAVRVVRPSGQLVFDARAIRILQTIGPHRPPPAAMLSPDGNAYIHWRFHRDQRACGTFGVDIRRVAASDEGEGAGGVAGER